MKMLCVLVLGMAAAICPAQTLTFASYPGTVAPAGVSNTPVSYSGQGSGTVTLPMDDNSMIGEAMGPSKFVTYLQGGGAPAGVVTYATTYTGNLAGYTGQISIIADDSAVVRINGQTVGSTVPYNTKTTIPIPAGFWVNGTNTITVDVTNVTGYTGLDFVITATAPDLCGAPTAVNSNPTIPVTAIPCPLLPNMKVIGSSGKVSEVFLAMPIVMQYCAPLSSGSAPCNPPFLFWNLPLAISTLTPTLGGRPAESNGKDTLTLYAQGGIRPSTFIVNNSSGTASAVVIPVVAQPALKKAKPAVKLRASVVEPSLYQTAVAYAQAVGERITSFF